MSKKVFGLLSLLLGAVASKTADQSSTGALIRFPYVNASSPLYNAAWDVAPGQFGFHDYGGSLEAYLVLPKNTSYHLECDKEPKGTNTYIHWVEDWGGSTGQAPFIFLIDRGDCYFVDKVENAQALGAAAVIVLDNTPEALFTMWPPEDWEDDITIPSVLLQYTYATTLMKELGVQGWNPKDVSSTVYPAASDMYWTIVRLEWGLPHPDDRVEYEIWTSANDMASVEFKKNWRNTALNFDYNNYTIFTPHVYILNGTHLKCATSSLPCSSQCTNSGRYCAVDPEYDLSIGITGMSVVQENLRSICVWKYINSSTTTNESLWWDYSNLWNKNCWLTDNIVQTFTETCSYQQMATLDSQMSAWVKNCVTNSGGYGYRGGVNTILESETRIRETNYIYTLPSILVNAALVHGNINCEQITEQTCQVLDAICAGFLEGTAPPQCSQTPAPSTNCSAEYKDCRNICFGQYRIDRCGQCLANSTDPKWDDCVGCDGVPNSGKAVNPCGYCMLSSATNWETYGKDCRGVCQGGYIVDSCGNCQNPSSDDFNDCKSSTSAASNSNDDGKAETSLTLVIIISVISFLVILLCAGIVYQLWKRQQAVDQRFTSIMKQYQLMDNQGAVNNRTKGQAVPDEDPEE